MGEEYERQLAERAKAVNEKRAKKAVIAKLLIMWDVKPLDDEINLDEVEKKVRALEFEGLTWGASKKVDVVFGIKKLVIGVVVIDDIVSTDEVQEAIEAFED